MLDPNDRKNARLCHEEGERNEESAERDEKKQHEGREARGNEDVLCEKDICDEGREKAQLSYEEASEED